MFGIAAEEFLRVTKVVYYISGLSDIRTYSGYNYDTYNYMCYDSKAALDGTSNPCALALVS